MYKILIVDDDVARVEKLASYICKNVNLDESSISTANSIVEAKNLLTTTHFHMLVLDVVLPNRIDESVLADGGIKLLEYIDDDNRVIKPSRIIGITAFEEEKSKIVNKFSERCFNLVSIRFNSNDWLKLLENAIKYSYDSYLDAGSVKIESIVIALHGIRTYGGWLERLENIVEKQLKGFSFFPYKYGLFSLVSFFIPPLRIIEVYLFYRSMKSHAPSFNNKDIYFVAHSFGTYILAYSLKYFPTFFKELKINRIILCGSVLNSQFNWPKLFDVYDFQLVNDCGSKDLTLCLSKMFVPGVGMAGRSGFTGLNNGKMINRYFDGGHSLYFESKGMISDLFMKTYWVECFMGKSLPKVIDQRKTKIYTPFIEFIMGAMGFVKNILFYGAIVYVPYMFFD